MTSSLLILKNTSNDITLLDARPDGFYLLVAARSAEARSDLYNADVIAAWMLLNYSLKVNGFQVINGYSDLLSPFLGAAGGDVGCTGWFNTLRSFSLDRFAPSTTGGRQPIQRYLSTRLLNRVTFFELNALRTVLPTIVNGFPRDSSYDQSEPERSKEVLQSWEALSALLQKLTTGDAMTNLNACQQALDEAEEAYDTIGAFGYTLDAKSDAAHIDALREGITMFKRLAEL